MAGQFRDPDNTEHKKQNDDKQSKLKNKNKNKNITETKKMRNSDHIKNPGVRRLSNGDA